MSKHSGSSDPFAGSISVDEKSPVDKLIDRLSNCRDDTERAIAQVCVQGHCLEGPVNAYSRVENSATIGFWVSRSLSVTWCGRRLQTKVERDPRPSRHSSDVFDVYDEGDSLKISFVCVGAGRCPANGDLIDPTDPDEFD